MAVRSGLSIDTLRWYEREGMLPRVHRSSNGTRRYDVREQGLVRLLASLRATGMPTSSMREFVALLDGGATTHGRRIAVLERTRELLERRRHEIDAAVDALDTKIDHYRALIAAGLGCDGAPVPAAQRKAQRASEPIGDRITDGTSHTNATAHAAPRATTLGTTHGTEHE
ncbi:MerR family transcriptional regulator [Pseudoclavibacter chungangensis]|uniref:MerR family transcriptional regulator n=2 Tax=Pseudoclavibacter chungangensis TaxID=587635 RepID=A0A7J5BNG6_9MICO|nr:MerR family transcriptional regulator [Pseudoclavibacter chungangensis]